MYLERCVVRRINGKNYNEGSAQRAASCEQSSYEPAAVNARLLNWQTPSYHKMHREMDLQAFCTALWNSCSPSVE